MQAPGREARQHEAEQLGQTRLEVAHAGLHRDSLRRDRRRDHRRRVKPNVPPMMKPADPAVACATVPTIPATGQVG